MKKNVVQIGQYFYKRPRFLQKNDCKIIELTPIYQFMPRPVFCIFAKNKKRHEKNIK